MYVILEIVNKNIKRIEILFITRNSSYEILVNRRIE